MPARKTLASVTASVKPLTRSIGLCLDGTLVQEIERLQLELAVAKAQDAQTKADRGMSEPDKAPELAARLDDLLEQARAAEVQFVFQSMGRPAWRQLVTEHPPTKDQKDKGAEFNLETFPVAAMAACLIEPGDVSVEGLEELIERLSDGQYNQLWGTCHEANTGVSNVPNFVAASRTARPSDPS